MIKKNRFLLLFAGLAILLSSCNVSGPSKREDEPSESELESGNIFDEIDLSDGKEIEDNSYFYSNQEYDVDPGYKVKLALKNPKTDKGRRRARALRSTPNDIVTIKDSEGNVYNDLKVEEVHENDNDYYLVSPVSGTYEDGAVCKTTLNDEEGEICFAGKNPDMKDFYFNIKDNPSNYRHVSNDVEFFDINDLIYEAVPDQEYPELTAEEMASEVGAYFFEHATYHFGYRTNAFMSLKEDTLFGVTKIASNGVPNINYQSLFYGRFVSSRKEGEIYRVTFKNADLTKIFKDDETDNIAYDIVQTDPNPELKNIQVYGNEDEWKEEFANNEEFVRLCAAVAIATGHDTRSGVDYILSHIQINPRFSYHDKTLDIQLKASAAIPVGESKKAAIKIIFTWQWSIQFATSGSCKVKKFLGVPYSVKVYGEVTKTTDFTFSFEIQCLFNLKPEEASEESVGEQISEAYKKLENDPAYFMNRWGDEKPKVTENHISRTICSLDIPFGYVFDFRIGLSVELTMDLDVFFRYTYHSHEVETMVAFSTDDGVEDTSNRRSNTATTHTIELGGQLYLEIGLRISISIGIVGLSNLFTLGVYVEGGIYFKAGAMGGISFGANQQTTGYGALDIDLGYYWTLTGFMDFLFVFHPKYDFAKKKVSLFGYSSPITIMDTYAKDVDLVDQVTNIESTKLLTVKQFDIPTFTVNIHTYHLYDFVKSKGDTFHPLTITFETEYSECIYVDVDTNTIVVTDQAPDYFEGKIKIHIDGRVDYFFNGDGSTETVKFTYHKPDSHKVNFGNNDNSKLYLTEGKTFTMPVAEKNDSLGKDIVFTDKKYVKSGDGNWVPSATFQYDPKIYKFLAYTDGTNEYQPGDTYTMGNVDVTISVRLYEWKYYNVQFIDCFNQVIKVASTREGTTAVEPTPEERNRPGYVFVGWDRYFNNVNSDLVVYGVYIKSGGNN